MKIAITTDLYYPMTNGVAVFARNLAKELVKKGHEVMVLCPSIKGKKYQEIDAETGARMVYLRSVRFPFYPDQINKVPDKKKIVGVPLPRLAYRYGLWVAPYPYLEMKKALKKFNPDVIHNQTAETVALAGRYYAKKYDIAMVSTGHAYPDNLTSQVKLLKPVKRPIDAVLRTYMASFLKHSEYATMPTEMAIGDLVPKKRKRFKVTVEALSNGVDLSEFYPKKAEDEIYEKYGLKKSIPIVLYVGRVDPEKSIAVVVESFALLLDQIPEAQLVIVGDGTDLAGLKKQVKKMRIENAVKFLGKVLPPELNRLYRVGWLFATASKTETQGIVLIEAAATGLPLVAVDAGAVGELCVDGVNGFLCEPDNVEMMAEAMGKILLDKKLRENFKKESLAIAKKHDLSATIARFIEIYQLAIEIKDSKS